VGGLSEIVAALISPASQGGGLPVVDVGSQFPSGDEASTARSLNAAFLLAAAGPGHPRSAEAAAHLARAADAGDAAGSFYQRGLRRMETEVQALAERDAGFADRLEVLAAYLAGEEAGRSADQLAEHTWVLFFPEAAGIRGREGARAEELRRRRTIRVTATNPDPLTDPGRQVLFTVNLLLTGPPAGVRIEDLDLTDQVKAGLRGLEREQQRFWYDHPVPIGVEPKASELLYGLKAVDRGVAFEKQRGTMSAGGRLRLVVSISTTHESLEGIARRYLEDEVGKTPALKHLDIYAFTEADTARLVDEVLAPAAEAYVGGPDAASLLGVFGVRGRYGRHHSFGKAIAALWHVLVDPEVVATFKTDLDHSWPQQELVAETGKSFLEHFVFPLWGGTGVDRNGDSLELGGMAGALVNEADIHAGLFTPDVPIPDRPPEADEFVFWSALPQGLSTLGEASTRYGQGDGPDGVTTALERVHVHAGTVGILVESLRRHRPFTPSFIGRAEDQAYVLSLFGEPEPRLAHVQNRELIQRHDKKAFAGAAIEASRIPTLIGDHERILLFSALADVLTEDRQALKAVADPFTGCFISPIPVTVMFLRLALKTAALFAQGDLDEAELLVRLGADRLSETLSFVEGDPSELERGFLAEKEGWDLFYDTLAALEERLAGGDSLAAKLAGRAREIVEACAVT
jgi:HAMP domain-containing protein